MSFAGGLLFSKGGGDRSSGKAGSEAFCIVA
jgi:hypothetical protein